MASWLMAAPVKSQSLHDRDILVVGDYETQFGTFSALPQLPYMSRRTKISPNSPSSPPLPLPGRPSIAPDDSPPLFNGRQRVDDDEQSPDAQSLSDIYDFVEPPVSPGEQAAGPQHASSPRPPRSPGPVCPSCKQTLPTNALRTSW